MKIYQKDANIQLTANFNSDEFDCQCQNAFCPVTYIEPDLVEILQNLRAAIGSPLKLNSAFRCVHHNKAIGGSPKSQHTLGTAVDVDLVSLGLTIDEFYDKLEESGAPVENMGIGFYDSFIHLDMRGKLARWYLRKTNKQTK